MLPSPAPIQPDDTEPKIAANEEDREHYKNLVTTGTLII